MASKYRGMIVSNLFDHWSMLAVAIKESKAWIKRGGGVLDRRDVLDIIHGRSRINRDPRIPTMPGRSMSGSHQPGRYCLHQARSAVRCSASRMKLELHPTKNGL